MYSTSEILASTQITTGNYAAFPAIETSALLKTIQKIQNFARPKVNIEVLSDMVTSVNKKNQPTDHSHFCGEETAPFTFQYLSQACRIMTVKQTGGSFVFHSALQLFLNEQWETIVYYEFAQGKAYRYSWRKNGHMQPFPINLPLYVVTEMAQEDFNRNWSAYCIAFNRIRLS